MTFPKYNKQIHWISINPLWWNHLQVPPAKFTAMPRCVAGIDFTKSPEAAMDFGVGKRVLISPQPWRFLMGKVMLNYGILVFFA